MTFIIKIVDMLRILSYGLPDPDPGHSVLTAHNGMSKKLRNGQKGAERAYGFRIRPNHASSVFIDRGHGALLDHSIRLILVSSRLAKLASSP